MQTETPYSPAGLPFEPQEMNAAAARFPAALETEWDGDAIVAGGEDDRPGLHRENVFDVICHRSVDDIEQWRLIVSIERHREFGRVLHVSASAVVNGPALVPFLFTRTMLIFLQLGYPIAEHLPLRHQFMHGSVVHCVFGAPEISELTA